MRDRIMTRGIRLAALTLVALTFLPSRICGQQNGTTAVMGGQTKSALRKIYDEDQKDRTGSDINGDANRREQIRQLIGDSKVQSGEDYYYAAFIFQHGQTPSDYLYAHILAVTAVSKGFNSGIWLCAATLDRYLQSVKQPQVFGTQYESVGDGPTTQDPYNKGMVSDALRATWCVASYATQSQILSDVRAGKEFRSTRTCPAH